MEIRKCGDTRFKMFQAALLRDYDLAVTIRLGMAFYFAMAMLATPAAICSLQHHMPLPTAQYWEPPLLGPAVAPEARVAAPSPDRTAPPVDFNETEPPAEVPAPPYHQHIIKASQAYQVEVALIKAVIMAESGYNPNAVSRRGAQGLMQLMPSTAKWLGVNNAFDPALNIDAGVRYLRRLLDRFDGDVQLALAAYNAGSRYVRKYGGVPPFKATHIYIKKVMKYRKSYREEMAVIGGRRTLS